MKTMKNLNRILITALSVFIFAGFSFSPAYAVIPEVHPGAVFLLPDIETLNARIAVYNRLWEFYPGQYIPPADFMGRKAPAPAGYVSTVGGWENLVLSNQKLPATGFGTYRLILKNVPLNKPMAFNLKAAGTAYRLFIGTNLAAECGNPGKDKISTIPQVLPRIGRFQSESPEVQIVMHIANFHDRMGGPWHPLNIGLEKQVLKAQNFRFTFEMLLCGTMLLAAFYQLTLFIQYRRKKASLYLGLFCLFISIRTFLEGERVLYQLFPDIGLEWVFKVLYISTFLAAPVFLVYLKNLFPDIVHILPVRIAVITSLVFSLFILAAPMLLFTRMLMIFNILNVFCIIYALYISVMAILRKKKGMVIFSAGLMLFIISIINDILVSLTMVESSIMIPYGFILFIISHNLGLTYFYIQDDQSRYAIASFTMDRLDDFCAIYQISPREKDVLGKLIAGSSYDQIAGELFISVTTARKHVHSLYQKTGSRNRVEICRKYQEFCSSVPKPSLS